jgi:hypothetical protein
VYTSHAANVSKVDFITLEIRIDNQHYRVDFANSVPLTRVYSYLEFERLAYFTGRVFDVGIDSDGNSKYDSLELRLEVNVTEAGCYTVTVQNLLGNFSNSTGAYAVSFAYLDVGVQLVNLTIYGPAIYASHVDPLYIGTMQILNSGPFAFPVDTLSNVPLPTPYKYNDFESHAYLIGTHSDMGVDTDGDGLFDYIAVGIDINVTKAGRYGIYTDRLMGQGSQIFNTFIYAHLAAEGYFTNGVHRLYLNCSGPLLAQAHFNPSALADVTLFETDPSYFLLGTLSSVPLSKTYGHSLFDAPLRDTQIDFVVYPNGTVSLGGKLDFTHIYPAGILPPANVTIDFSTSDNTTTSTANGTIAFPPSLAPLDSATGHLSSQYVNGLLNATADATVTMPPEIGGSWPFNTTDFTFNSTYSNGLLNADLSGQTMIPSQFLSTFPFNITDTVVLLDYGDNDISGNITFHTVSGLPLTDVITYVSGNRTHLHLTGNLAVVYGNYFGTEIDSATVDNILANLTGMIQEMSRNDLEFTQLNTTKTPLYLGSTEYGTNVDYNATLHGNFTKVIAELVLGGFLGYPGYPANETRSVIGAAVESFSSSVQNASLRLMYYRTSQIATFDFHSTTDIRAGLGKAIELVPAVVPSGNRTMVEAWLKIANITASAYEDFGLYASYSSATQTLGLREFVSANSSGTEKEVLALLPDTVPPELRETFEAYVNTTYAKLKSWNVTFDITMGTVDFVVTQTYEGDYRAELNREKRFITDYMEAIMQLPGQYATPTMFTYPFAVLNGTEVDINNFKAQLNSSSDWIYFNFSGILLQPPKDQIDSIQFKLSRLFNATSELSVPSTEFDRFGITITGGTDANETVLLYVPSTVTAPINASLDDASMSWENTAPSNLTDLRFLIAYQAVVSYGGITEKLPIVTNSTISAFSFNPSAKSISFNVEGPAGTGFCNVTIPKSVLYASAGNWTIKIDDKTLPPANFTVTENAEYVFIYFDYPQSRHSIEITGTTIVPEFKLDLLLPLLVAVSLIAVLITVRRRRTLTNVKTGVSARGKQS